MPAYEIGTITRARRRDGIRQAIEECGIGDPNKQSRLAARVAWGRLTMPKVAKVGVLIQIREREGR